jgi:hypothetical protein
MPFYWNFCVKTMTKHCETLYNLLRYKITIYEHNDMQLFIFILANYDLQL